MKTLFRFFTTIAVVLGVFILVPALANVVKNTYAAGITVTSPAGGGVGQIRISNVIIANATTTVKPDLVVTSIALIPEKATYNKNDIIEFAVTFKNNGTAETGKFTGMYYVNGQEFSTTGTMPIDSLQPGASATVPSPTYNFYRSDGTYWAKIGDNEFKVIVDEKQVINESDEGNNTLTKTFNLSDVGLALRLYMPNYSGQNLNAGETYLIQWQAGEDLSSDTVSGALYKDGILSKSVMSQVPMTDQRFNWVVPTDVSGGSGYTVRIWDNKYASEFVESSQFSIDIPAITVVSPNGGEKWQTGGTYTITWKVTGVPYVDIYLYSSKVNIKLTNTGSYQMYYPDGTKTVTVLDSWGSGDDYKIKIVGLKLDDKTETVIDTSDKVFSIGTNPDLLITKLSFNPEIPTMGEQLKVTYTIKNQGNKESGPVDIQIESVDTRPDHIWLIQRNGIPSLAPGGSVEYTDIIIVGALWGTYKRLQVGENTVQATVDYLNKITELVESNNTLTRTLSVVGTAAPRTGTLSTMLQIDNDEIYEEVDAVSVALYNSSSTYLNGPAGTYIPLSAFGSNNQYTFTLNNVSFDPTDTYKIGLALYAKTGKTIPYTYYTITANGTALVFYPEKANTFIAEKVKAFTYDGGKTYNFAIGIGRSAASTIQITNLTVPSTTLYSTEATVTWQTNVPTDSIVYYRKNGTESWSWAGTDTLVTAHEVKLTSLELQTTYEYYVNAKDANGNIVKSETKTFVTTSDTIVKIITVIFPNGGEQWKIGGTYEIKWTSSGNIPKIDITTYEVPSRYIASSIANAGKYTWTIPSTFPTGQYKLQVAEPTGDATHGIDQSDGLFSIVSATTTNHSPIISEVSGPQSLSINQTGTWTIKAYDSDSNNLTYKVNWGDGGSPYAPSAAEMSQTVTFTHTYSQAGTYAVTFTVSDDTGLNATSSLSVEVVLSEEPQKGVDLVSKNLEIKNITHPDNNAFNYGDIVDVRIYIKNIGTATVSEFYYTVSGYAPETRIRANVLELTPGAEYQFTHRISWPQTSTDTITFVLESDSDHQIKETNEDNNVLTKKVYPISETEKNPEDIEKRIIVLLRRVTQLEQQVVELEKKLVKKVNQKIVDNVKGKILLQVEKSGEAWYVEPVSENKFYMKDGTAAYDIMRGIGLGISNANLAKIPIGVQSNIFGLKDGDGDGVPDKLESAVSTDANKKDTDGDGRDDKTELLLGYNALGSGTNSFDSALTQRLTGRIVLQVESKGEAWYINPSDNRRYYLGDPTTAFNIMRFLSLGITNNDLRQIQVGEFEGK